ncbi:nuclear factor 7, brain-like isoform X2 [Phycodurus eques]|uniref:nuclear factor 7, brain-like isoform X2 n=1 Tax=Phycodurus eques TaxID=693459 RepID=UPI002ACDB119|nr:nuclear factor 7, brain-like isoform X2 [Phycodurus eques]
MPMKVRPCLKGFLDAHHQCPQCRASLASGEEVKRLSTNFILLSLAEKAKLEGIGTEQLTGKPEVADMCLEHDEKLKLYCVTDKQLICIICRDCERHGGHAFKPIKEAAASLKNKLEEGLCHFAVDIKNLESLVNAQREKIEATKQRSCQLLSQISAQFTELHQFLEKREKEVKDEVKLQENNDVVRMTKMLNTMAAALSESRAMQGRAASFLEISNPEKFLKDWVEYNGVIVSVNDYKVVEASLYLGPYETHLKFLVWKEMLQVIKPREEQLVLKEQGLGLTVSSDGRSLLHSFHSQMQFPNSLKNFGGDYQRSPRFAFRQDGNLLYGGFASSENTFTSGQHYWEIEVGQIGLTGFWEVGIRDHIIKYDAGNLSTSCPEGVTPLTLQNIPRKIGIYLDCSSHKLAFYNATDMTHIHTVSTKDSAESSTSAFLKIQYRTPNIIPFTASWY